MLVNLAETIMPMEGAMITPLPTGNFMHLVSGHRYIVVQAFIDFDRDNHPVGETWTFIGSAFLPYDDGLSLFVETDASLRHIRMQWREEEQGPIIDRLDQFIAAKK
jgi:hypothetical protein